MWEVFVTGWNEEDESVEGEGYGDNEDAAVYDACKRWGITEIGEMSSSRFIPEGDRSWIPKALYLRDDTVRRIY